MAEIIISKNKVSGQVFEAGQNYSRIKDQDFLQKVLDTQAVKSVSVKSAGIYFVYEFPEGKYVKFQFRTIRPVTLDVSESKIKTHLLTYGGWRTLHWGMNSLVSMTISGKTGYLSSYNGMRVLKQDLPSNDIRLCYNYIHFWLFLQFYRRVNMDVKVVYEGVTYIGCFDSISYKEDANNPFNIDYVLKMSVYPYFNSVEGKRILYPQYYKDDRRTGYVLNPIESYYPSIDNIAFKSNFFPDAKTIIEKISTSDNIYDLTDLAKKKFEQFLQTRLVGVYR